MTCAGNINFHWELFKLGELSIDMFKCLAVVQGLTTVKDKDIRSRILNSEITLHKVTEECQRLKNVKRHNTRIEEKNISRVQTIKQPKFKKEKKAKMSQIDACGGYHLKKSVFMDEVFFRVWLCRSQKLSLSVQTEKKGAKILNDSKCCFIQERNRKWKIREYKNKWTHSEFIRY